MNAPADTSGTSGVAGEDGREVTTTCGRSALPGIPLRRAHLCKVRGHADVRRRADHLVRLSSPQQPPWKKSAARTTRHLPSAPCAGMYSGTVNTYTSLNAPVRPRHQFSRYAQSARASARRLQRTRAGGRTVPVEAVADLGRHVREQERLVHRRLRPFSTRAVHGTPGRAPASSYSPPPAPCARGRTRSGSSPSGARGRARGSPRPP
jgi:hypothetical protein